MKKNLLAVTVNEAYVEQAKALFSSVYFNAGWRGDYMLLSGAIPEDKLKWFRDKGILIYKCDAISTSLIGFKKLCPQTLCKFYLFKPEFKKWDNIVYLDVDIIVRAPIDELTKIKGFAAVYDVGESSLYSQFLRTGDLSKNQKMLYEKLRKEFDLRKKTFNAGVMAFNTNIIRDDTFLKLKSFFSLYSPIHYNGDQPTFNLFFYKKWQRLARVYNVYATKAGKEPGFSDMKGIILHIMGKEENKPWSHGNYYYNEWKNNLEKAENIDILRPVVSIKPWPKIKIWAYSTFIYLSMAYYSVDKTIGRAGLFIKKKYPSLYGNLKKIKDR